MDYTHLTPEQQESLLIERLTEYEAKHFQSAINYKVLIDQGVLSAETAAEHTAMTQLDKAHARVTAELTALRAAADPLPADDAARNVAP